MEFFMVFITCYQEEIPCNIAVNLYVYAFPLIVKIIVCKL